MKIARYADVIIALSLLALLCLFNRVGGMQLHDFSCTDAAGRVKAIQMPFTERSPTNTGTYVFSGKLTVGSLAPRRLRIVADDAFLSLQINNTDVDLRAIPEGARNDWNRGFAVDLSRYLKTGENQFRATVGDHGGSFGLRVEPDALLPVLLCAAFVAVLMLSIARRAGLGRYLQPALIAGVLLRVAYLSATRFDVRTHDVWAHLEYIQYFVNHWKLPPVDYANGGAFFHPPFYYFIAALFQSAIAPFTHGNAHVVHRALQWFSVSASMGYLLFGLFIVQRAATHFISAEDTALAGKLKRGLFAIAGLLVTCWPSAVLHSARISNDSFLYVFFAGGLFYLVRWYDERANRDLWLAALFAALATMSKANGVVLVPVAVCTLFCVWVENRFAVSRSMLRRLSLVAIIPLLGAAIASYPGIALKLAGQRTHTYVSNMNRVGADLIVGDEAQNLLWFDIKMFVVEPFTSPWDDKMGRQYFGNYLGKTGLFGEWRFDGGLARNSAVVLSIGYLIMSALILYGFYRMPRRQWFRLAPHVFTAILLVAAISEMRMSFPVNIDFRYILPIIICYGIFSAASMSVFLDTGRRRLAIIGVTTQLIFLVSTVIFFCGVITNN